MATITIKITGINSTTTFLKNFRKGLEKPIKPLQKSSKMYLNAISANFQDDGQTFGVNWPPLSEATIRIKRNLRKEGKSIGVKKPLLRTGLLRKSFNYTLRGSKSSIIFNRTDYASLHQLGGEVEYPVGSGKMRKVPKRMLARIDNKRLKNIEKIFNNWIGQLMKKHSKK